MHLLTLLPFLSLATAIPQSPPLQPFPIRALTFNIRYAVSSPSPPEPAWSQRLPPILSQLQSVTTPNTFFSFQEVLHAQLVDLLSGLNGVTNPGSNGAPPIGPKWGYIGVARDDGVRRGEYSPVIYPLTTFELLRNETTWLSPTPDKPSKGWDAGSIRILTTGVFRHKETGRKVIVGSTHLDNAGERSRRESIPIISAVLKRVAARYEVGAVVLGGDFNSRPDGEAYKLMAKEMKDLYTIVGDKKGGERTWTGFDGKGTGRIDFVWVGEGIKGEGYEVLENAKGAVYFSDHKAVLGDLVVL
ncbi:hypothetical protein OQA88_2063 [Cercophora sp. LCS_1]